MSSAPVILTRRRRAFGEMFPGAAAHYGFADRYANNQTCCRVRRSSDHAETDVTTAQIRSWLPSWVGSGNSGFVVTLYDLTGNGNHKTQTTTGSQPKIVSGGALVTKDGMPAVEYDGSNDYLEFTTPIAARSIFAVQTVVDTGSNLSSVLGGLVSATNSYIFFGVAGSHGSYEISIDGGAGTNDSGSYWRNGTLIGTGGNIGSGPVTFDEKFQFSIIYDSGDPAYSFAGDAITPTTLPQGKWIEQILYTSDQSSNRAAIDAYLMSAYGLS